MTQKPKVLLIDDQRTVADLMEALLKQYSGQLLYAANGAQGIQMAKSEKPALIFLDIMMPGLDGFKVCRYLKEDPETREIPLVFLSAGQDKDIDRGKEAGGDAFVRKPFVTAEILTVLRTFLKG